MPPLFLHMAIARDIGSKLRAPALEEQRGAYYFGATTPDVRVLTRGDRRDTHYFDLDVFDHQDSVAAFFAAQPALAAAERLDPRTIAFVAGYVTHLLLDETYIQSVYRPYFGQLSALGGDANANMLDRLLQYELDRRRREHSNEVDEIRRSLCALSPSLDVGFLDSETLQLWLQVAIDQTQHPPDWRRFRFQGARHLSKGWAEDEQAYAEFLQTVPELLERTIKHVSTAQVDAFVEQTKERAQRELERYLGCV